MAKVIAGEDEKVPSPFLGAKITTDQKQRSVEQMLEADQLS